MESAATELHHLAGLTAGSSIVLRPGSYHFGADDHPADSTGDDVASHHADSLSFTLTMSTDGRVEFSAPTHLTASDGIDAFSALSIHVDGQPATWLPDVRGAIINAGPSRFLVTGAPIVNAPNTIIPVPDRAIDDGPALPVWRGCGPRSTEGPLGDPFLAELLHRVNTTRRALLAEQWFLHGTAEQNGVPAPHAQPTNQARKADHPLFATVAIAAGDVSWRPRFDKPAMVSAAAASAVQPLHKLASAPITADLKTGSLGIVGRRDQRLAAARHVVMSLAARSSADDIEFAILARSDRATDWRWADGLPHVACESPTATPILVVDGVDQLEALGLPDLLEATGGIGAIVLADDPESLPLCSTVMFIGDAGMAAVVDHATGRTVLEATPLGMPVDVAVASTQNGSAIQLQSATSSS